MVMVKRILGIFIILALLASSATFVGQIAAADDEVASLPPLELPDKGNPKLDSQLNQLVSAEASDRVASFVQGANIELVDGEVRVIVECLPGQVDAAIKAAIALGAKVETSYHNLLQIVVPISQLTALADTPDIRLVRLPWRPVPGITSEGVALINADDWQTAGYDGTGVKVGVLDLGFSGYAALLGTELPATVTTWWAPSIGGPGAEVHGTACAEIIYDIAPGADFYLANLGTDVEIGNAVDWLIAQGVDVISCSVVWPIGGPGDGTGTICDMVDDAHTAGIIWSQSMGNYAQGHWQGDFNDPEPDAWHNFSGTDISNAIYVDNGDKIAVSLKWDDTWGSSGNDYDLHLIDDTSTIVASSLNTQDGDDDPRESLQYDATYTGVYHIAIYNYSATETVNFHLFSIYHNLQYQVASSSLTIPSDSPNAMSVGAVFWNNPTTLEVFSSQGPTEDARTKPDLVAPDGVSTATYGASDGVEFLSGGTGFFGTSASAPHAAGAAVLVKECYPSYTPAQIQAFLEGRAIDLGGAGKDNLYGSGRLDLGSLPNTPPEVTNVTASQSSPTVDIAYDVSDAEQSDVTISFEYWDGDSWEPCDTATGEGTQSIGTGKSGSWDAKADFDEHYMTDCKIQVTADDEQAENDTGSDESSEFILDTAGPTVTINQAVGQADPTNTSPINFTVVFSESVDDFATGDVTLDGTAGATTATVTGSGTTYNVAVSGMTSDGTVTATIAADVAHDALGNGNDASTSTDNEVTYDITPPGDPTNVQSTSHTISVWSTDNTVDVTWTDADDATSGLDGYSILWDTTDNTVPDASIDIQENVETTTSPALADGDSHYFHIRSVDNAGNWQSTVHLGPFFIDTTTLPTMEAIVEPEGQYYNTAPSFSNFGFDDNLALDDGWYQMDSYAGTWEVLFTDAPGTSWEGDGWTIPGFATLAEGSHTIYFKASDDAGNVEGEAGEWSWQFFKDTTAPTVPTNLDAPAYVNTVNEAAYTVTGDAETDSTVEVRITDGTITVTNTGTATGGAFSIIVDCSTLADGTDNIDIDAKATDAAGNESAYSTAIVRSKDTVLPTDPTDVTSPSHTPSTWSTDNTVDVTWTDTTDATSGLDGYSVLWDTTSDTIPPTTLNIEDGIETTTSAPLADGNSHYFHISSVDNAGNWQSTVHLGPFYIDTTPPAAVTDLAAGNPTRTSMELTWTAPGDDTSGAETYDIRYSASPIDNDNWDSATPCTDEPTPSAAGSIETFTVNSLSDLTTYYFALKTADKVPNWSTLSNVASEATQNRPPVLSDGAVSPTSGYSSTTFTYSVTYTDAENDSPNSPMVTIDDNPPEDMAVKAGDGDYINGETYEYTVTGADLGLGSHTFQFAASDGTDSATGDIGSHDGPTVRSSGGGGGGGGGGDTRAPVISNIECSDCTKTSIIIKWITNERGTSQVESWASEHMFSPLDETLVLYHEVELTNLKPCCVYHFRTISKDSSGNEAISEEQTFTTLGTPATFTVSSLSISPFEVKVSESITISALVTNTGDGAGTYEATLKIDDVAVATKSITLAGRASEEVIFTTSKDVAGTYTVSVDGQSDTVVVKAPATFTVSSLSISPAEAKVGESIIISALITNTGDGAGTYEATLKIDDVAVATKSITLAGRASEEVIFTTSKDVAGTYTVDFNGLPGTFTVKAGLNWWLIGGIIAAVVAAGLLVYFYVWRKRGV